MLSFLISLVRLSFLIFLLLLFSSSSSSLILLLQSSENGGMARCFSLAHSSFSLLDHYLVPPGVFGASLPRRGPCVVPLLSVMPGVASTASLFHRPLLHLLLLLLSPLVSFPPSPALPSALSLHFSLFSSFSVALCLCTPFSITSFLPFFSVGPFFSYFIPLLFSFSHFSVFFHLIFRPRHFCLSIALPLSF